MIREPLCGGPNGQASSEEMNEVDPHQSQRRSTYEPHEVMMINPNDRYEEITHRIADGGGPQRPEIGECRLLRCLELQYHNGYDHCEDRV
jgi:hypothetical protein